MSWSGSRPEVPVACVTRVTRVTRLLIHSPCCASPFSLSSKPRPLPAYHHLSYRQPTAKQVYRCGAVAVSYRPSAATAPLPLLAGPALPGGAPVVAVAVVTVPATVMVDVCVERWTLALHLPALRALWQSLRLREPGGGGKPVAGVARSNLSPSPPHDFSTDAPSQSCGSPRLIPVWHGPSLRQCWPRMEIRTSPLLITDPGWQSSPSLCCQFLTLPPLFFIRD